jgi:hypothetical protein
MADIAESVSEAVERGGEGGLNTLVALAVAVTATFMALCNVKAGNTVQAMQQEQTAAVDAWAYYQAKSTKQNIAEAMTDELSTLRDTAVGLGPEQRRIYDERIAAYAARARQYEQEKGDIRAQAQGHEAEYRRLNVHDDQFDLAEACLSITVALLGVTALTRKKWLLGVALAFGGFGVFMGLAGFARLPVHPGFLVQLLG